MPKNPPGMEGRKAQLQQGQLAAGCMEGPKDSLEQSEVFLGAEIRKTHSIAL